MIVWFKRSTLYFKRKHKKTNKSTRANTGCLVWKETKPIRIIAIWVISVSLGIMWAQLRAPCTLQHYRIKGFKGVSSIRYTFLPRDARFSDSECDIFTVGSDGDPGPSHFNPFMPTVPTFAVRETASLGIMGAPRVPPLNPSESIVLSEHYRR